MNYVLDSKLFPITSEQISVPKETELNMPYSLTNGSAFSTFTSIVQEMEELYPNLKCQRFQEELDMNNFILLSELNQQTLYASVQFYPAPYYNLSIGFNESINVNTVATAMALGQAVYRFVTGNMLSYTADAKSLPLTKGSVQNRIRCTTLHHTALHCTTPHHTASHCTTPHHTASHCKFF